MTIAVFKMDIGPFNCSNLSFVKILCLLAENVIERANNLLLFRFLNADDGRR